MGRIFGGTGSSMMQSVVGWEWTCSGVRTWMGAGPVVKLLYWLSGGLTGANSSVHRSMGSSLGTNEPNVSGSGVDTVAGSVSGDGGDSSSWSTAGSDSMVGMGFVSGSVVGDLSALLGHSRLG